MVVGFQVFKKCNDDVCCKVQQFFEFFIIVDFVYYCFVFKNQVVVDEIEKCFMVFKFVIYDVFCQFKVIDVFEVEVVKNVEVIKQKVDLELKDLEKMLVNIESVRLFEEFIVDEVVVVELSIDEKIVKLVSKGCWFVFGYKVCFELGGLGVCGRMMLIMLGFVGEIW